MHQPANARALAGAHDGLGQIDMRTPEFGAERIICAARLAVQHAHQIDDRVAAADQAIEPID